MKQIKISGQGLVVLFAIVSLIKGCSSSPRNFEHLNVNMDDIKRTETSYNFVPQIKFDKLLLSKQLELGRGLSSVNLGGQGSESKYSNRILYFLTMAEQYLELKELIGGDSYGLETCPAFHSNFLNHFSFKSFTPSKKKKDFNLAWPNQIPPDNEVYSRYPFLALPIKKERSAQTVFELAQNESSREREQMLEKAINLHLEKTMSELRELCEFGQSDNYYTFENYLKHISTHPKENKNKIEQFERVAKLAPVNNMIIINSLQAFNKSSRRPASIKTSFSNQTLMRLKTDWAKHYFQSLAR